MAATLPRLTASRLQLARTCPGSFSLPHFRTETAQAERGTGVHAFIEGVWNRNLGQGRRRSR